MALNQSTEIRYGKSPTVFFPVNCFCCTGPPKIGNLQVMRFPEFVLLSATIYANPPPKIEWRRAGKAVVTDARVTLLKNGTLRLCDVTNVDTGDYEVVVSNQLSAGTLSRTLPCCGEKKWPLLGFNLFLQLRRSFTKTHSNLVQT